MRQEFIAYIAEIDGRSYEEVERMFNKFDDKRVEKIIIKLLEVNKK